MYVSHMCSVLPPTFTYMALVSCYHIHRIPVSYPETFTSRSRCRSHSGEETADGRRQLLLGGRRCMHVHHTPLIPTKSHHRSISCVLCVTRYSIEQLHLMYSCSDPTEATTATATPADSRVFHILISPIVVGQTDHSAPTDILHKHLL